MKTLLLATVGVLCVVGVSSYSEDPVQYHIQTDDGSERYFRYQTYDGQYRKEKRLDDGTVIGTYGWVDATGLLRLYDYVADLSGYRIVRKKTLKMAQQPRAPVTEAPVRRNPSRPSSFRTPSRASVRDQPGLSVSVVRTPTPKPSYTLQRTSPIRRPQAPRGTAPTSGKARRRGSTRWGRRPQGAAANEERAPTRGTTFTPSRRRPTTQQSSKQESKPQNDVHSFGFGSKLSGGTRGVNNLGKQTNPDLTNTNTAGALDSADAPSQGLPLGESGSEAQPDPATVGDPTGNPATHANRGHGGTATKLTSHTTATQASGEAGTLTRRPVRVGSSSPRRRTQSTREHLVQRTGDLLIERTRDLVTERPGDKVTEAPINGPINRRLPEAGTYSINYDLGNQFHKEKILPDGTKVGKHGYVDPLGILRVTYYTTGPNGHQQSQESKWVGTRDPYQE
ncbi:putative uncharacterized protein ENSP00000383309 isoform X1 [Penaeus monodon]|uniref:putative uncharacterized protein ENSP00000383309 isoform X1 n=1 Tax=Penaeus monodon TaxID=6687 RepID=UPI0018A7D696|nr:putative uncharacterized protein ENSP00000383309 isoform X1 [Penaeus monodon]XP_037799589.1 putative uncharacterized protein ENSP00000383309 isoform X1 [Penaeus monodon]